MEVKANWESIVTLTLTMNGKEISIIRRLLKKHVSLDYRLNPEFTAENSQEEAVIKKILDALPATITT